MQSQDAPSTASLPTTSPAAAQPLTTPAHDGHDAVAASTDKTASALLQQDLASLPQLRTGTKGRKQRSEEERKARRRESNRISAKRMRQRRAESTSNLRKEVADLKKMNAALELDNNSRMKEFTSMKEQNERIKEEIMLLEAELKEMSECPPDAHMMYPTPTKPAPAAFTAGTKRTYSDIRSPLSTTSTKAAYDFPRTPDHITAGLTSSHPSPPLTPLKHHYGPFSSMADVSMRETSSLSDRRSDGSMPAPAPVQPTHVKLGKLQTAKIGLPGRSLVLSPRSPVSPHHGTSSSAWHTRGSVGGLREREITFTSAPMSRAQSSSLESMHPSMQHSLRSEGPIRAEASFGTPAGGYYMDDRAADGYGSYSAAASQGAAAFERTAKVPRLEPLGRRSAAVQSPAVHSAAVHSAAVRSVGMRPSVYMDDLDLDESEREDGGLWVAARRSNSYQHAAAAAAAAGWPELPMSAYARNDRMAVHRTAAVHNC